MEIKWLNNAKEDLLSIYSYYYAIRPEIAQRIYNNIILESGLLSEFPHLGKVEPLLNGLEMVFRSLVTEFGKYKIIYYIYQETIYISHVWDCRQNPDNIDKSGFI